MSYPEVERLRKSWKKNDARRDRLNEKNPADVSRINDISYGSDSQQKLDIYRPKAMEGPLPTIISVHGGAFVYGSKETYQFYGMDLARRGFVVINFSYRLAPEHPFPSSLSDVIEVFNFVQRNQETYGFDLTNLFAVGDSAGATLLSLYINAIQNQQVREILSIQDMDGCLVPKAICLNCGMCTLHGCEHTSPRLTKIFHDIFSSKEEYERYRSLFNLGDYATKGFPPTYFLMANADFTTKSAKTLQAKLHELGVETASHRYGSLLHPLFHVFHLNIKTKAAAKANDDEMSFFKKHMED